MEQITLYHHNSSLKTLSDYMEANNIIGISVNDLFEENRNLFFSQMSLDEKSEYCNKLNKENGYKLLSSDLKSDMTLPCPCIFKIEAKYVTREIAISQTNFQKNTDDIYAFENSLIQRILSNSGYKINKNTKKIVPKVSVWGWFKSLYFSGSTNELEYKYRSKNNKFINISDFITELTTNVGEQGGTFSITLPIIHSRKNIKKKDALQEVKIRNVDLNIAFDTYTDRSFQKAELFYDKNKNFFHKIGLSSMEDNYFNFLIQSNDLLFISFEDLEMEKENDSKIFDMIGLVEKVIVNQDSKGQGSVIVTGKDLMKLITDDNSCFFNISSASGESQIFDNTESLGKQGDIRDADILGGNYNNPENRLRRSTNQIDIFAAPFNRSIDFVIKGVISQLANIEIVPDYVFTAWGDMRTKYNDWLSYQNEKIEVENEDEYGDKETYNTEFSSGIEFNQNRGKDKKIGDFLNENSSLENNGMSIPNSLENDNINIK